MTLKRMDNVGIVVDDLAAAIDSALPVGSAEKLNYTARGGRLLAAARGVRWESFRPVSKHAHTPASAAIGIEHAIRILRIAGSF